MLKSWALFALGLVAACGAVLMYEDKNVGFTILYALLFLLLPSLASAVCARFFVGIEETAENGALFKNETLAYTVKISNKSLFFYPRVTYTWRETGRAVYTEAPVTNGFLAPGGAARWEHAVRFPCRGIYRVGIQAVYLTDLLGLFRVKLVPKVLSPVVVYPEIDSGFLLPIRSEPQNSGVRSDPFQEDYSSVADLRKYIPSDSLRKIHWKLSAQRGELIVKNYHSFDYNKTVLFLDTRPVPETGRAAFEDKMTSFAASAAAYCMESRLPASLVCGGGEPVEITGADEIVRVFEYLAGVSFKSGRALLPDTGQAASPYNLVLFLSGIDNAFHDAVRELISFDRSVLVYYFYSDSLPEQQEYLLESLKTYGAGIRTVRAAQAGEPPHMDEDEAV